MVLDVEPELAALRDALHDLETRIREGAALPPWYHTALGELGVAEIPGPRHNARILEYHAVTRGPGGDEDETAWCASFACWCLDRAGMQHPASKRARSLLTVGEPCTDNRLGALVVLWRGSVMGNKGHVGFRARAPEAGREWLLGGNQGNRVSVQAYDAGRVLGVRWPVPVVPAGT